MLWTGCLAAGFLLPGSLSDELAVIPPAVTHAVGFAVFTWLWVRAFPRAPHRVALCALAFAGASELAQLLLPALGRGASWGDAMADVLGIGLGLVPWVVAYARRRGPARDPWGRRTSSPKHAARR